MGHVLLRRAAGLAAAGAATLALTMSGAGLATAAPEPPMPIASIPEVTGNSTSVALDSGFVEALTSLDVAPSPSGDATVEDGVATFPITSGNVTVFEPGAVDPYVQGSLVHEGSGLTLTKGDTEVTLDNFIVDPGNPATLTGRVSAGGEVLTENTLLFDLDGSTLEPITTQADEGTATLKGTTVKLADGAAEALNGAFGTDALQGGTTVGIATIVVKLPQMEDMPAGGVDTGGGSTSGAESLGLLAAGGAALLAAGGLVLAARRRGAGAHRG